jgi:glutaminyl-tRNA synthetase
VETRNFVEELVAADVARGAYSRPIMTRFPPEPGGCLHIGHAKGIFAGYGVAQRFGGYFNLRLDDTDPEKDYAEHIPVVVADVESLGIDLRGRVFFASDYFQELHEIAVRLIRAGRAYVCDLDEESLRELRGDFFRRGRPSPYRDRSPAENLELFQGMSNGRYEAGAKVLRAKIDYDHDNVLMRDPVMYRILHTSHYRQGNAWCVYPRYDFSHCLCDAIEGVTHSICGKEFEVHRPLYDWFLQAAEIPEPPKQIEYAELRISNTILGKRHIRRLISHDLVAGWDDPRLLTLRGLWRRGYSPEIVRSFVEGLGLSRTPSLVDIRALEAHCRDRLNKSAPRRLAVLRPVRLLIENYPEDRVEYLDAVNNPEEPAEGSRRVAFSRELVIDADDFMVDPPRKFYRLAPGREVRLRYGYLVTCTGYETDRVSGRVTLIRATYDPLTRGGNAPDGRKVKSTLHWLSRAHAESLDVRLFGQLTDVRDSSRLEGEEEILASVSRESCETVESALGERALGSAEPGTVFQFERSGYFCMDRDSSPQCPVYNRVVTLKDPWAKIKAREART